MIDSTSVKNIKEKIAKNESKLKKQVSEVEKIWEDTGLDPKDPSYLVEKTCGLRWHKQPSMALFRYSMRPSQNTRNCVQNWKAQRTPSHKLSIRR